MRSLLCLILAFAGCLAAQNNVVIANDHSKPLEAIQIWGSTTYNYTQIDLNVQPNSIFYAPSDLPDGQYHIAVRDHDGYVFSLLGVGLFCQSGYCVHTFHVSDLHNVLAQPPTVPKEEKKDEKEEDQGCTASSSTTVPVILIGAIACLARKRRKLLVS